MTGQYVDDNRHLKDAIAHALAGRRAAADAELRAITRKGPERTLRLWQALAETALLPNRRNGVNVLRSLPAFVDHAGNGEHAPAHVQLAMRVFVAQAGRDQDALQDVFQGALDAGDQKVMDGVLTVLLDAAVASARAQQAISAGTFGSGQ